VQREAVNSEVHRRLLRLALTLSVDVVVFKIGHIFIKVSCSNLIEFEQTLSVFSIFTEPQGRKSYCLAARGKAHCATCHQYCPPISK
jgi:hypothetical protein